MNIVIIEDEVLIAQDIARILIQLPDKINVVSILHSVSEAKQYLEKNEQPDLIFCDIQLEDGLSFEIFTSVRIETPVIFCTAYNEYALDAFRNNGIDYILKPFTKNDIINAIEKYKNLHSKITRKNFDNILMSLRERHFKFQKNSSLLIRNKDKIIPIKISNIALFYLELKSTQLVTFENEKYIINQTLDELSDICGADFYRVNRQYLINKASIAEAIQYFSRKLILKLTIKGKYEIIVSKNKISDFLKWLES